MAYPSPAAAPPPLPPQPPALPADGCLSTQARQACAGLVYKCLKLTIEAKKKLTPEQRSALGKSLDGVIAAGQPAFGLAVAVWLRNKKELGNRLVSTNLLAACVHREATRPFCRQAARLVIKLPTDLAELNTEFAEVARSVEGDSDKSARVPAPSCLKKIAKDVVDNLDEFQAGKYDSTSKIKRARAQLKRTKSMLEQLVAHWSSSNEVRQKAAEKRVEELEGKLSKFSSGDIRNMIRHTHAGKQHDLNMSILRKRYPETEEEFKTANMSGTFDPELCGTRLRVPVPPTWDRQLSEKGNVPRTWAELLTAKDDKGRYTLPYMALLRNLRNILLMGFQPSFLRKHVLQRLTNRGQIQGSGQTPISLTHTWAVMQAEFTEDKLQEMKEQSDHGFRDIVAYKCLLKKFRAPILGRSDKLPGIIGEFLGEPVWAPCGLRRQNDCFLALSRVLMRGGKILDGAAGGKGKGKGKGGGKVDKWLPVALFPVTPELLSEFKGAFDQAIQVAASCVVEPMRLAGTGPVVLWMDMSNPPLQTDSVAAAVQFTPEEGNTPVGPRQGAPLKKVLRLAGLTCDHDFITTHEGQECELDEITTHKRVALELRYFAGAYIDYNISAFDSSGKHLWNSTYSNTEIRNKHGNKCVVHSRDVCTNPSPTEPALRVLHLDLDALDDEVFVMVVTSQNFSGVCPEAVSIALRECHQGGAERFDGNHGLSNYAPGKVILAQDIGHAMTQGGTTIYSAIYRDVDQPTSWLFRNTLDMSLETGTMVASQVQEAAMLAFKQLFQESALKSSMDPATVCYVRLCQLYQAFTASKGGGSGSNSEAPQAEVAIVLTGVRKNEKQPSAQVITLTGRYVDDLNTVRRVKQRFSGKAVEADIALDLAMGAAGCSGGAVAGVIRIANNAMSPVGKLAEFRKKAGRQFPYGTVDAKGHILDAFAELPRVPRAAVVPGQVESCVAILRNMLEALETKNGEVDGDELLVRYVDHFLPRGPTDGATSRADVVGRD